MGTDFNPNSQNFMTDISSKIKGIFAKGAAQGGQKTSGDGAVDCKEDVKYIFNEVNKLKAEKQAEVSKRGVTDLQAISQSEAEIEASVKSEMQKMLGADFARGLGIQKKVDIQKGAAYSDEEISLENLMSLLDDDVDKTKVAEQNKKGTSFGMFIDAGFEEDFVSELDKMPEGRKVAESTKRITDAGIAKKIGDDTLNAIEEFGTELKTADVLFSHAYLEKNKAQAPEILQQLEEAHKKEIDELGKRFENASTKEEKDKIVSEMFNLEILYNIQREMIEKLDTEE